MNAFGFRLSALALVALMAAGCAIPGRQVTRPGSNVALPRTQSVGDAIAQAIVCKAGSKTDSTKAAPKSCPANAPADTGSTIAPAPAPARKP